MVNLDSLRPFSCCYNAKQFPHHSTMSNVIKRDIDVAGMHLMLKLMGPDRGMADDQTI